MIILSMHDEADQPSGLLALVHHLLDHSTLPVEARTLAHQILAVEDLRPLPVRPLSLSPAPLAFWRKADTSEIEAGSPTRSASIHLVLIDLKGNAGQAAVMLPHDALPGDDTCTYAVVHSRSSVGVPPAGASEPTRPCPCARPTEMQDGKPSFYSKRELVRAQLHVSAPPQGLTAMRVLPVAAAVAGSEQRRVAHAHLLSSLLRLSQRPREFALDNDAAILLRESIHAAAPSGRGKFGEAPAPAPAAPLERLWASLINPSMDGRDGVRNGVLSDESIKALAQTLAAALHMAAAAGMLEGKGDRPGALSHICGTRCAAALQLLTRWPPAAAEDMLVARRVTHLTNGDHERAPNVAGCAEPLPPSAPTWRACNAPSATAKTHRTTCGRRGARIEGKLRAGMGASEGDAERASPSSITKQPSANAVQAPPPALDSPLELPPPPPPPPLTPSPAASDAADAANAPDAPASATATVVPSACGAALPMPPPQPHTPKAQKGSPAAAPAMGTPAPASTPAVSAERFAAACASMVAASHRHIVFVTPEMGQWCTVGGLGAMVSHLSSALAAHSLGEVTVVAPAYDCYSSVWSSLPVQHGLGRTPNGPLIGRQ